MEYTRLERVRHAYQLCQQQRWTNVRHPSIGYTEADHQAHKLMGALLIRESLLKGRPELDAELIASVMASAENAYQTGDLPFLHPIPPPNPAISGMILRPATNWSLEYEVEGLYGEDPLFPFQRALEDDETTGRARPLVSRLRNIRRWNRNYIAPRPTVMAHSFMVAYIAWLNGADTTDVKLALFHDFSESVCKDVITPTKEALGEEYIRLAARLYNSETCVVPLPIIRSVGPDVDMSRIKKYDSAAAFIEASEGINNGCGGEELYVHAKRCLKKFNQIDVFEGEWDPVVLEKIMTYRPRHYAAYQGG